MRITSNSKSRSQVIVDICLFVGLLVMVLGLADYLNSNRAKSSTVTVSQISVIERGLAVERAKKLGEREYSFTTNFIPGIGVINDPEIFLQQWKDAAN